MTAARRAHMASSVRKPGTLTYLTAATAFTAAPASITVPATVQAGDLMVIYIRSINNSGTPATPSLSGWTIVGDVFLSNRRGTMYVKIASGADASSTITANTATAGHHIILEVFRPDIAIASVSVVLGGAQITDSAPSGQTVAAASQSAPLVIAAAYASNSSITTRGFSPAKDGEYSSDSSSNWLAYKIYNASPADESITMADYGNGNTLISAAFVVS